MQIIKSIYFLLLVTLVATSSCRLSKRADEGESVLASSDSDYGGRTAKIIPWDKVEVYEYQAHKKSEMGPLKVNPDLRVMKSQQKLRAVPGFESMIYLWVAVVPNQSSPRKIEFRYGPEHPMPGAPDGGTPEEPKKAKFGHATLTGWDPAISGGEIHFHDDDVEISNDSGRINRFYPESQKERGAFCDSADLTMILPT